MRHGLVSGTPARSNIINWDFLRNTLEKAVRDVSQGSWPRYQLSRQVTTAAYSRTNFSLEWPVSIEWVETCTHRPIQAWTDIHCNACVHGQLLRLSIIREALSFHCRHDRTDTHPSFLVWNGTHQPRRMACDSLAERADLSTLCHTLRSGRRLRGGRDRPVADAR